MTALEKNEPVRFIDYAILTLFMLVPIGVMAMMAGAAFEQDLIFRIGIAAIAVGFLSVVFIYMVISFKHDNG